MTQRDPFRSSHVESRRNRPAKPPLSRDAIVDEALRQITSDDGAGMSLRRIAKALDTGPASLYAYVDDMTELQALVLDRALDAVAVGEAGEPWRDRLDGLLRSYAELLSTSPALAQLAVQTTAVGPNALRIAEALLEIFAEAGVEPATAAWAIDMLTMFVAAVAAEHALGSNPAAPDGPVAQAINRAAASEYPRVHAARDHIMSGTGEERFTWFIDILVRGILSHDQALHSETG
ncbi:TetR/AcrR family transcriptional regulator [Amycolatopsis acidiphila]|nr:TetR/AcrR family transcriptional regulator [Amycolatopsis acidiphila]UIJ63350.1 TetR/AcrR family transcriptional regulator [Amycolatopsis acidiphila]GHG75137.1 TetR family transcriptional regulator [Amycolatopsis acidiphila]